MKKICFKLCYGFIFSHQKKSEEEIIYEKGSEKLHHELNVLTFLQTIQKMKATLSVLINDEDEFLIHEIKHTYYGNQSIYTKDYQEKDWIENKNEFQKFMDRDDRNALRFEREMRAKYKKKTRRLKG